VGQEQIERAVELRRAIAEAGGLAVVERFIGTQRGLTRAERDLVLDWADNSVRGIFELRGGGGSGTGGQAGPGAVIALNRLAGGRGRDALPGRRRSAGRAAGHRPGHPRA